MQKLLCVVALSLAVGCGPNFTGSYSGTLATNVSCSDGSGGTTNGATTWMLAENGPSVSVNNAGSCSPFTATLAGNMATLDQKTCSTVSNNGVTSTGTITGGSLALNNANGLAVAMNISIALNNAAGGSASCTGTSTGTLARQP